MIARRRGQSGWWDLESHEPNQHPIIWVGLPELFLRTDNDPADVVTRPCRVGARRRRLDRVTGLLERMRRLVTISAEDLPG